MRIKNNKYLLILYTVSTAPMLLFPVYGRDGKTTEVTNINAQTDRGAHH